ncbi:hypothetical protein KKB99_07140 [bacterium]|nr:hypothetical protein [bacterium]MBU1025766.1 hypothetical protein [bacterium]
MIKYILSTIIILTSLLPCVYSQIDDTQDMAQIEISAVTSKIRWEGDIIRQWSASGDVSVTYVREDKAFKCKADNALFIREGDKKPFKDKLEITGNIQSELNGMHINTGKLYLLSDAENYSIESDSPTVITTGDYSLNTDKIYFDASNNLGQFPDGAEFIFSIGDNGNKTKNTPETENSSNLFGQCLRMDTNGGRLVAPVMQMEYLIDEKGRFIPSNVNLPNGGELLPISDDSSFTSTFTFDQMKFDLVSSFLDASGIAMINGPCKITAGNITIDWERQNIIMSGDVLLSREMIDFQSGIINILWDDEGRLSLTATEKPKMRINVPEEITGEK